MELQVMATATPKISLNGSRDIPFNKLVLSQSNVRRTKAGVSIDELAESIAERGLLQSLYVRPVRDEAGVETGMFEIPAGGRRFRALQLLVKAKRMAKTQPVPCIVKSDGIAEEDSLAENEQRVNLHPLDQFRAFLDLREKGLGEEEIAARFFVTPAVVKQRLRLASVSPKLLAVYAEDGITLDQLMAFTVNGDHKRQEQVWNSLPEWSREPWNIKRQLTQNTVPASDRRVLFVGIDAYEAAGGRVDRDLFTEDRGGWLRDVGLLDQLVGEKLKVEAASVAAEGWKWIEAAVGFPYGHDEGLREIDGEPVDISPEEQATVDSLRAEFDRLEADYAKADEYPAEVDARLGEIEAALETLEVRPMMYQPADMARAGVFISLDSAGDLVIARGYVRPEDDVAGEGRADGGGGDGDDDAGGGAVITVGGQGDDEDDDDHDDDRVKPLPDRLVMELTAHRTLALHDAMANDPHTTLTALLHRLCLETFMGGGSDGCVQAFVRRVSFPVQTPDLNECAAAQAIDARHEAWKAEMPSGEDALWDWLVDLDDASRAALLAHCVSFAVNALHERGDRHGAGPTSGDIQRRLHQADRLARAVRLDMVEAGWRTTVANYLGRVTKARILEAVREARGEAAAQLIDHLKKDEMAREAERLLDGTGWLPEPLRTAGGVSATPDVAGDDDASGVTPPRVPAIAAE
jgi:ParB family chromosome partitioning protein